MRVLLTGAGGMLATALLPALREAGHEVTACTRSDLDITQASACAQAVAGHEVVINAAAWTAVDEAQTHEPQAYGVNAVGAAQLARAAQQHRARMVQISTDYVFDGQADQPYGEDDPTAPASAYGRTKLAGEWAVRALCSQHYIVRTAWLYGAGGGHFLATMARLSTQHDTLTVVDDQRGQPTWTGALSAQLVDLIGSTAAPGVYHGTATGQTTWFGLTRALFTHLGLDAERVQPTTSEHFVRPAPRPSYSVLGHERWRAAGIELQPSWEDQLRQAIPSLALTAG